MKISTDQVNWHGQDALLLETTALRVVVVPEMGAKIVSLFDKQAELEWLVGPGDKDFSPVPYGASFIEQDMSGWDEMFPTIVACDYPLPGRHQGVFLPDHGEIWTLPWTVDEFAGGSIRMSVESRALPLKFTRTLGFSAENELTLVYEVSNHGSEQLPYLWAAHPQFDMGDSAEIILPAQVRRVISTTGAEWGWGPPETAYDWPLAVTLEGITFRLDHVGPPSLKRARKFFIERDQRISWSALVRNPGEEWLVMSWSTDELPYFGLWVDEGALGENSVATPEPMTGFYDGLNIALAKGEIALINPGESQQWLLTVQTGRGKENLKR